MREERRHRERNGRRNVLKNGVVIQRLEELEWVGEGITDDSRRRAYIGPQTAVHSIDISHIDH